MNSFIYTLRHLTIGQLRKETGAAMIIAIGALFLMTVLGASLMLVTTNEYQAIIHDRESTKAYFLAEAGIEKALKEINSDQNYSGIASPANLADGQYEISVTSAANPNQKVLTSTGYYPDKSSYKAKRVIRAILFVDIDQVSFSYAMQAGAGGIEVGGSSEVVGTLYSNGNIDTIGKSCEIQGDAYAVGSISNAPDNPQISGQENRGAPTKPLPEFNLPYWQAKTTAGGVIEGFSSKAGTTYLGPKKIIGDLKLTGGTLVLTGPIWVTGNIDIGGNAIIKLDPAFATYGTLVMADGTISLAGTASYQGTTQNGYIMFVSNYVSTTDYGISLNGGTNAFENIACYAKESGVSIQGSGDVVALTGYRLQISGNGEIRYKSGLADAKFSGSPGGGWVVQSGSFRESAD